MKAEPQGQPTSINMELGEKEAEGIYSNFVVISHSLVPPSGVARLPAQLSTVSGISSSDEAKIGGITPAVLSLIGRCERSCCMPRAV